MRRKRKKRKTGKIKSRPCVKDSGELLQICGSFSFEARKRGHSTHENKGHVFLFPAGRKGYTQNIMQSKRAKYTLRSTEHPSYRPSRIIDGYLISAHRDDFNIAYYLVYCPEPGPKHGRLYSQLPGYRNWGQEVRDSMTDQYTGL